jgi:hypothetical protein
MWFNKEAPVMNKEQYFESNQDTVLCMNRH